MAAMVSVILVVERAEQLTGSGCCGKLEGDSPQVGELFREARAQQQSMGVLYRAIQKFFAKEIETGRLGLICVDPRNQLYLWPKLWRDVCRYRPGWRAGLRTAFQLFAMPACIVNGQVLQPVDPDALCHRIAELLGRGSLSDEPAAGSAR